jgi:hypothetical protein
MRTAYCVLCGSPGPVVANPLKVQAATPGKLLRLTRGLTRTQLLARPAPGKWSIHEIICHLADTEVANAWRYRKVLAEDEVGLTAWDQDRWAAGNQYRRQDLRLALEQFRSLRVRNLALLRVVGRKRWARAAAHATLGVLSAAQMVVHLAHHDAKHVEQIKRIRKTLKKRPEPSTRVTARVAASRE